MFFLRSMFVFLGCGVGDAPSWQFPSCCPMFSGAGAGPCAAKSCPVARASSAAVSRRMGLENRFRGRFCSGLWPCMLSVAGVLYLCWRGHMSVTIAPRAQNGAFFHFSCRIVCAAPDHLIRGARLGRGLAILRALPSPSRKNPDNQAICPHPHGDRQVSGCNARMACPRRHPTQTTRQLPATRRPQWRLC